MIGWTERGTTVHAVVNHLHFKEPVDPDLFRRMETEVGGEIKSVAGFRGLRVVLASERHVILVIFGDTGQTLDDLATLVGNTWMRTNVGRFSSGRRNDTSARSLRPSPPAATDRSRHRRTTSPLLHRFGADP